MSKYSYTDEQFITAVETSLSIAEVCRKLNILQVKHGIKEKDII